MKDHVSVKSPLHEMTLNHKGREASSYHEMTLWRLPYRELGCSRRVFMEAEHDDLQAVATIGALEEAWLQQVRGHHGRQVDPPIGQTVAVKTKPMKQTKSLWPAYEH